MLPNIEKLRNIDNLLSAFGYLNMARVLTGREEWKKMVEIQGDRKTPILFRTKGGYSGYTKLSKVLITIFNIIFSMTLIILGFPIFLIIGLIINLRDRGPILYSGERLGINKKKFTMYKFRTLPVGAQRRIGASLLSPTQFRLPFFSKFLRDTRLDELPQLFNILKCDMDFVGPRPLRPEIYEKMCKNIPDYDLRFSVRPGLIGYSQLFTPHSSPKRIRALIDNNLVSKKRNFLWEFIFVMLTILLVLKKTTILLARGFWEYIVRVRILREYVERRALDRVRLKNSTALIFTSSGKEISRGMVQDINEKYFRLETDVELAKNTEYQLKLFTEVEKGHKQKRKVARCKGKVYRSVRSTSGKYINIIEYEPISQLNQYIIDQYFLDKSFMHL